MTEAASVHPLRMEVDFVTRRWKLFVNGSLAADFVPLSAPDCTSADVVNWPEQISAVWGICYADHLLLNAQQPFRHHKGRDGF